MYRILPLRTLRRTAGVLFDEVSKSDIPKIDGIDRVIHSANGISPGPVGNIMRPWYMHKHQDDNLIVLQGERFIDIYCPNKKEKASFVITPEKVYKNGKLYCSQPAMVVWPAGIFHRIISGSNGSISLNFATRHDSFSLEDNFHIYSLDTDSGSFQVIRDGKLDQPDLTYKVTDEKLKLLLSQP